jgi:hypothetical protein
VGKSFPVILAEVDKARVRGQIKGLFLQAIKVEIHSKQYLITIISSNKKGGNISFFLLYKTAVDILLLSLMGEIYI